MAGSTTTTLNDLLPQIVAEAMFVASERSIMRGLVKNYSLGTGQGKTVTVPIYPTQTAAALTEGDEISNTAVSTNGATLTVTTAAIRTLVTDLSVAASASNVVADIGRLFGEAIARKIDLDLTAQFGSLSAGFVGQLAGIPIFETSNIANTGTAGDYNGAVFHRDCLGIAMIGDITVETERRASFLGTDVVAACHYGAGILQNAYGRYLQFDSSI